MSSYIEKDQLKCYNPATMESLGLVPFSSSEAVHTILDNAKKAATSFNATPLRNRKRLIRLFRKALVKKMDQFVGTIRNETGKSYQDAVLEFFVGVDLLTTKSVHVKKALSKERRSVGLYLHKRAWVEYHPHGVAGIISPWNYPFILTLSPVVEALLAGNTVVLKPSEHTPLTGKLLKETFDEITNQKQIFQIVLGTVDVGKKLIESENTDIICFTGSTAVGRIIAAECGERLKPCILELGGKDAMIILEDADLERAANACIWGGFSNAGQTCISVERVIVCEPVFDKFIEKLKLKMEAISCGETDANQIGAMTMPAGLEKVNHQLDEVKPHCRDMHAPVNVQMDRGQFCVPTLVIEPDADQTISHEETFGPVISVNKIKDEHEAIQKANESRYGLAASVFTANKKKGRVIAKKLQAGMIMINDVQTGYGIGSLPFGGVKDSGIGRVHGIEGLRSFSRVSSVVETRFSLRSEPWWYSGIQSFPKWIRQFVKFRYR